MSKWIERHGTESLKVSSSLSMELVPGTQARDWRQRWIGIQEHLKRLRAAHPEPMSAASIQNANHDLQSFFVQAYHLKDSLKQDAGTTGVPETTIENAITADPHLALLADLANLDKHGKWDPRKKPRRCSHMGRIRCFGRRCGMAAFANNSAQRENTRWVELGRRCRVGMGEALEWVGAELMPGRWLSSPKEEKRGQI